MKTTKLHPMVWALEKQLKSHSLLNRPMLLMVSGGVDSVVLLDLFCRLRSKHPLEFQVFHVHHGLVRGRQRQFRRESFELVKVLATKYKVPFWSNLSSIEAQNEKKQPNYDFALAPVGGLSSEEDYRNFRELCLQACPYWKEGETLRVTGHNANDLLETRVHRLVRGAGEQGLIAMTSFDQNCFRPLLGHSRADITDYAKSRKLKYISDPSNTDPGFFRNWLRHDWLPRLEQRQPGSLAALERSLEVLAQRDELLDLSALINKESLDLTRLIELSEGDQRRIVALFMRKNQMKNYGLAHIKEVLKRLDTDKKRHSFTLLKHSWVCDAGILKVKPN